MHPRIRTLSTNAVDSWPPSSINYFAFAAGLTSETIVDFLIEDMLSLSKKIRQWNSPVLTVETDHWHFVTWDLCFQWIPNGPNAYGPVNRLTCSAVNGVICRRFQIRQCRNWFTAEQFLFSNFANTYLKDRIHSILKGLECTNWSYKNAAQGQSKSVDAAKP